MPSAEVILWSLLKGKKYGVKFRRQHSVGPFVVDFFCKELNLVIEVDGPTHFEKEETEIRDREREAYLKKLGLNILRFTNEDIYRALDGVMRMIMKTITDLKNQDEGESKVFLPCLLS